MSSNLDAVMSAYLAERARVECGERSVERQPQSTSGQGSPHCCATECKRLADEIVSLRGVLEHLSSLFERTQQQSPVTCRSPMSMNLPVQLSLFSGVGRDHDFRSWIRLFERVTRACGITESPDLLSILDVHLTGPASRLLTNLRRDGVSSFEAVKSALMNEFAQSMQRGNNASLAFYTRTQTDSESITEYVSVLYDLSEEVFPSKPLADLDFVLRDRFITGVRPELACLCDFDACESLRSAVECAKMWEDRKLTADMARRRRTPEESKAIPADEQNEPSSIPHAINAAVEQRAVHEIAKVRGPCSPGHHFASNGSPICDYCNKVGHKFRSCRQRVSDRRNRRPWFNHAGRPAPRVVRVEPRNAQSENAREEECETPIRDMVPAVSSEPFWSPMFSPPVCDIFSLNKDDSTAVRVPAVPAQTTELRRRQTDGAFVCTSQPRPNFRQ